MNATDTSATFRHGPLYFAGVAALLLGALAVGALFLVHPNRALTPVAQAPAASPTPSQAEELAAAPVASVTPFQCSASTISAAGAPAVAAIDAVRTGSHPGYDRLVVQFSGKQPGSIELRPQATSNFLGSPPGGCVKKAAKSLDLAAPTFEDARHGATAADERRSGLRRWQVAVGRAPVGAQHPGARRQRIHGACAAWRDGRRAQESGGQPDR